MSAEFTEGPRSFYDGVMDMCLPCMGREGDRCVFTPNDNDQTWVMTAVRQAQPNRLHQVRRFRSDGSPMPFPACQNGTITECYFQEDGNVPLDTDACYDAVFGQTDDGLLPPPDWDGGDKPIKSARKSRKSKKPAVAVAQARVEQCPFYVCAGQSYRAANGVIVFDHAACKCADKSATRSVRR